jgi:hypothetical protein
MQKILIVSNLKSRSELLPIICRKVEELEQLKYGGVPDSLYLI